MLASKGLGPHQNLQNEASIADSEVVLDCHIDCMTRLVALGETSLVLLTLLVIGVCIPSP